MPRDAAKTNKQRQKGVNRPVTQPFLPVKKTSLVLYAEWMKGDKT